MDVVVREVLRAACEVSEQAVQKLSKFANETYETSDGLQKAFSWCKNAVEHCKVATGKTVAKGKKTVESATRKGADIAKQTGDRFDAAKDELRKRTDSTACKVREAAQKAGDAMKKTYGEAEVHALYYKLGKLTYRQTVERDDECAYRIVELVRGIAKRIGEEEKLFGQEQSEEPETAAEPSSADESVSEPTADKPADGE